MTSIRRRRESSGQALVELAFVLIPFLFLLMGIVDLGRAVAINNGVAQAAREIARATAVHPGSPLGSSAETQEAIRVQRALVLNLSDPAATIAITCSNLAGTAVASDRCHGGGKFVRVEVRVPFLVLTPVLSMINPMVLQSTAHLEIP